MADKRHKRTSVGLRIGVEMVDERMRKTAWVSEFI